MTIARELFLFLAPPEYLAGIGLLGIMQLRWIFTMGVYLIDPGTAKTGKTYWVSIILGIAVLVNLGSNWLLTSKMGLYGAVISELLGLLPP
jgi:O-antigen/teichoic acid export membrane protein